MMDPTGFIWFILITFFFFFSAFIVKKNIDGHSKPYYEDLSRISNSNIGWFLNKRISKEITQFLKQNNGWNREWLAWLEKQGEQKPVISDDALREGISHFGITQYQIDNWLKKYVDVEKQSEQKNDRK